MCKRLIAPVGIVAAAWLVTTYVFWVGYAGTDDLFYSRYAFFLDRPPINWWEFRIPAVFAITASFSMFGASEFAAALPSLLGSLAILASVAWLVDWPTTGSWQGLASMILMATLPFDVGFRSVPGAICVAAGCLAVGTACLLKGGARARLIGAAALSLGFVTHEMSFFYIAIFCLAAVAFDRQRFLRPVAACVLISALAVAIQCWAYKVLLNDPWARFRVTEAIMASTPTGYDPDTQIGGLRFFTWPLENLLFCKVFGFDLAILLLAGVFAWKRLGINERILLAATFLTWAWLGYGTMIPWAYKPTYRQVHYYFAMTLGVAALLPTAVDYALHNRRAVSQAVVGAAIMIQILCSTAGGRWGQDVDVSRELLRYADQHRDQVFVTDVLTLNHMYVLGGFKFPQNVVCLKGSSAERHLLVNKEPPNRPRYTCPERVPNGVLVNVEGLLGHENTAGAEFMNYLDERGRTRTRIIPVQYRPLFVPFLWFMEARPFMVRSLGGEMASVN